MLEVTKSKRKRIRRMANKATDIAICSRFKLNAWLVRQKQYPLSKHLSHVQFATEFSRLISPNAPRVFDTKQPAKEYLIQMADTLGLLSRKKSLMAKQKLLAIHPIRR